MSRFAKIYIAVLAVFVVLLIAAIFVLNALLRDFESKQPKYAAQSVFEKYFSSADELLAVLDNKQSDFESREVIRDHIAEILDGDVTYTEVPNGVGSERKYAVKSDGKREFTFTLDKDDSKKSFFGFSGYALSGVQIERGDHSVVAEVPEGYSLYINGVKAGDEYITEREKKLDVFEYLPDDVAAPTENVYTVTGLYAEAQVSADDGSNEATVTFDEERNVYKVSLMYDESLRQQYSDYVIEAAEAYAAYMQNDSSFRRVSPYLDPASELYTKTRDTITAFVIDHDGYSFEDESATEFTPYDENTFSCRVKLTHKLHKSGSADYVEYFDVTFFLHRTDGDFLIFDRFNTN